MKIISHRGYWKNSNEKNQRTAFIRSFDLGYGVETDFRDCRGEIVIAHDMPNGNEMTAEEFFSLQKDYDLVLAMNIKADGLAHKIKSLLEKYHIENYFVFDMSIPDTLQYLKLEMNVFARVSEFEPNPIAYDKVTGIWLDAFYSTWYSMSLLDQYLSKGKFVCLVSPELHQRNHLPLWDMIKEAQIHHHEKLILCTDYPEEAKKILSRDSSYD